MKPPRLLCLLALTGFLLLTVAPATAETLMDTSSNSVDFTQGTTATQYWQNKICFYRIQDWDGLTSLYTRVPTGSYLPSHAASLGSYTCPITLQIGSTVLGTGTANYNVLYNSAGSATGIQYWLDLDSFSSKTYIGTQYVTIVPASGTLWGGLQHAWMGWSGFNETYPIGFAASNYVMGGNTIARATVSWANEIEISDTSVTLTRTVGGKLYASSISVATSSTTTDSSTHDITIPYTGSGTWTVTSTTGREFTGSLGTPSPESSTSKFALSLSTDAAAVYEPIQATLSSVDDSPYDCVYWNWDSYHLHEEAQYRLINGQWYLTTYNGTSQAYENSPTEDNPLIRSISFPDEGKNSVIGVRVYNLATKQKLADLQEYIDVSGQSSSYRPLMVKVYDGITGKTLMDVDCEIKNLDSGETTQKTIQQNYFGEIIQLQATDHYKVTLSKTGYESRTWDRIGSTTTEISAFLPRLADPSEPDQVQVFLTVNDPAGKPIPGASVQIGSLPVQVTNSRGQVQIEVTKNTTYQITVSKNHYRGVSDRIEVGETSFWEVVHLSPEGSEPGDVDPSVTPDYRSPVEKAEGGFGILSDNLESIASLAVMVLIITMIGWLVPKR